MNLPQYIEKIGITAFSKQVEVSKSAAYMYQRRERVPKRSVAERIVARTPLNWEDIYEPTQLS